MEFKSVNHAICESITNESLSEYLQRRRELSEYEIDGVIITNDREYSKIKGNPKHSIAFKMVMEDQKAETTVTAIKWNASKDGRLKPIVEFVPITINGVNIQRASGYKRQIYRR